MTTPTPGSRFASKKTGKVYTVVKKRRRKGGTPGSVKMVHLDGGVIKVSVEAGLFWDWYRPLEGE